MAEKSILDARLAEIDSRLRTIQSGLAPAAPAAPAEEQPTADAQPPAEAQPTAEERPLVVPEAAPVPKRLPDGSDSREARELVGRLTALAESQERLLAMARALVTGLQAAGGGASVSVSAGPFVSTDALRRFEHALQTLPEVTRVTVREYEGADRAIVDVHLAQPTP